MTDVIIGIIVALFFTFVVIFAVWQQHRLNKELKIIEKNLNIMKALTDEMVERSAKFKDDTKAFLVSINKETTIHDLHTNPRNPRAG